MFLLFRYGDKNAQLKTSMNGAMIAFMDKRNVDTTFVQYVTRVDILSLLRYIIFSNMSG